jgi:hypothetical protein
MRFNLDYESRFNRPSRAQVRVALGVQVLLDLVIILTVLSTMLVIVLMLSWILY